MCLPPVLTSASLRRPEQAWPEPGPLQLSLQAAARVTGEHPNLPASLPAPGLSKVLSMADRAHPRGAAGRHSGHATRKDRNMSC